MPQKVCGGYIFHVMAYTFFLNCAKIEQFQFFSFSCSKSDHILFFETLHFFMLVFLNAPFSNHLHHSNQYWFENGVFQKIEHKKWSPKKARDQISNRKRGKTETVRFWGVSEKLHMASRKYILHILFGTFHVTSCKIL